MSLAISRSSESGVSFFYGIDSSYSSSLPLKTTAAGTGIYVNQNYVLKWPDSTYSMLGKNLSIPIYAIAQSHCGSGSNLTLVRYNESTGKIETCGLSTSEVSLDAAHETLNLAVFNSYQLPPLPTPSFTEGDRNLTGNDVSANEQVAITQFSEFKGRCLNCSILDNYNGLSSAPNNLSITPNSTSGSVQYHSSSGFEDIYSFIYDGSGNYNIEKQFMDVTPAASPGRSITLSANKGETLSFKETLSATPNPSPAPASAYRWYVNGCLKQSGMITSNTITFNYPTTLQMSGLNNNCSGEFSISESGSTRMGQLLVRLNIVNNVETITSTSDGATQTYLWKVNILNNQPNIQTQSPLKMSSSQITGNRSIALAMPVSISGTDYLSYTDLNSSTGLTVRLRSINYDGSLASTGANATSLITSQPTTMGLQPGGTSSLAVSTATSYPTSSADTQSFFSQNSTSLGSTLSGTTFSNWTLNQSYASVAGYSVFSQYHVSTGTSNYFQSGGSSFDMSTNVGYYYLIDGLSTSGYHAVKQYWNNNINSSNASIYSIYGTGYAPWSGDSFFTSTVSSEGVRRNIVSGNYLFQFIGGRDSSTASAKGGIVISSLATNGNYLTATKLQTVHFDSVSPGANDCAFAGTPLDGTYVSSNDTLYFLSYSGSGQSGVIGAIVGATSGSAICTVLRNDTAVANPSLNLTEFNPNMSKSAFDSNNGYIFGLTARTGGNPGQAYFIDVYTNSVAVQDLPSGITPTALIFSKLQNAVLILDGDNTTSPTTKTPSLYRIW